MELLTSEKGIYEEEQITSEGDSRAERKPNRAKSMASVYVVEIRAIFYGSMSGGSGDVEMVLSIKKFWISSFFYVHCIVVLLIVLDYDYELFIAL